MNDTLKCPGSFGACCDDADVDCRKRLDNTAYPAVADDEFAAVCEWVHVFIIVSCCAMLFYACLYIRTRIYGTYVGKRTV